MIIGTVAVLPWVLAASVSAQTNPPAIAAERMLTNIAEIWSLPQEDRGKVHRIRTEVLIYFFDGAWGNAVGECLGKPSWLPLGDAPQPLKSGQRVAIDGAILPLRQRMLWDQTRLQILETNIPLPAERVSEPRKVAHDLRNHRVTVDGLIDGHGDDPTHYKLNILLGNTPAMAYVLKAEGSDQPPFHDGDFIRMTCCFIPQFDRNGDLSDLALWASSPADVEVIGSLQTDTRFALPVSQSVEIQENKPANELLHVKGVVRNHEPGKWVTIWDANGVILVESKQSQALRFGDRIEAIGYPHAVGVQQCLHRGLYRLAATAAEAIAATNAEVRQLPLRLADQVRGLTPREAKSGMPVALRAVVTWADPGGSFAYVQDASGGIRVMNPTWENPANARPGNIVSVEGITAEGEFVPSITNAVLRRVGWWNLEPGPFVPLEQAMTGLQDGQWVEMRGYAQAVHPLNRMVRIDLSTPSGEFQAWAPATQSYERLAGTIVRVQGVCSALSNARHQLTGIQLWVPEERYIRVEEPAPDDLFAAPLLALGDLRRFNLHHALDRRVRTAGTVVLHAPGRFVFVQDGVDSVFALSHQEEPLQPGDRVEVVGFPGNEGRRFLLREAVYRKLSAGTEPAPLQLPTRHTLSRELEGLLTKAEGHLLNLAEKDGETRLLVQIADSAFEADLVSSHAAARAQEKRLPLGSRILITGVYEVHSDEYGKPRSFVLHLRSWKDVHLLEAPPWWTKGRLGWTLLGVLSASLLGLLWGLLISRKNKLLQQTQAQLRLVNEQLEQRVKDRTRDLAGSLSLLNATLESTADGILVVDGTGMPTSHNRKFAQMWRLPADLTLGGESNRLLAFTSAQTKEPEAFVRRVREVLAHTEMESLDTLELNDGRIFERYSQARHLDGRCIGRVWCFRDVTGRKRAEAQLAQANRQLVESSRQVGMAEIATSVLHNVGNVLNSVNVSATLVDERLHRSPAKHLNRASELLDGASGDFSRFLHEDPNGKTFRNYFKALLGAWRDEHQEIQTEMESLRKNIDHIKVVVAMQQSYARIGGAVEELDLHEVMEDAVQINSAGFERERIKLNRTYQTVSRFLADRHKLLQILVNLLSNAKYALENNAPDQREIVLTIRAQAADRVCLQVTDNGVGIEPENLQRIFNQGFTTRKNGHGFGLHSSAIAASEMNGVLTVRSDGPGRGATFTLELPVVVSGPPRGQSLKP